MTDPQDRFSSVLNSHESVYNLLPLVHITDAYSFVDILAPKTIDPVQCDVFKQELVYFFYGRPAYRTKHSGSSFIQANLPVAFIFDPNVIEGIIKSTYPFDTGAFAAGFYADFFHKRSAIEHFRLANGLDSARRIVAYFYRSNEEYLFGGSRKNVDVPPLNFEVEGVFELARMQPRQDSEGRFAPDLRSSSIELIADSPVDVTKGLIGLIIPASFLGVDAYQKEIQILNPKYLETYNSVHNIDSSALLGLMFEKATKIYRASGYIT